MKPDYKNWVPKSMVYGLAGGTVTGFEDKKRVTITSLRGGIPSLKNCRHNLPKTAANYHNKLLTLQGVLGYTILINGNY